MLPRSRSRYRYRYPASASERIERSAASKTETDTETETMGGGEVKVATVDVEGGDNMATLPVSRSHTAGSTDSAEKNNAANKEMELKNVMPQPLQRCEA